MRGLKEKMDVCLRMIGIITVILFAYAAVTYAAGDLKSKITSFTPGTTIKASDMNSNSQALISAMPGAKYTYTTPGTHVPFTSSSTNILSLTVTPPMDGHLLLLGFVGIYNIRTGPVDIEDWAAHVCITDAPPTDCATTVRMTLAADGQGSTPAVLIPATVYGGGPCTGGTPVTYYLTANTESGSSPGTSSIDSAFLIAIFLPGSSLQ